MNARGLGISLALGALGAVAAGQIFAMFPAASLNAKTSSLVSPYVFAIVIAPPTVWFFRAAATKLALGPARDVVIATTAGAILFDSIALPYAPKSYGHDEAAVLLGCATSILHGAAAILLFELLMP
jgi:hypothetical protein